MDWLGTLKTLAPTVATALGGPLAGAAVEAIGSIIGVPEATQDKIADAFTQGRLTADQIAQIKALELQYQNDERERGFKYAELEFKDRDSARQMAIATKSNTPTVLSYLVLAGGGGMMFAVLGGFAKVDSVLAGTLIGYAVGEMKQVLQYWFGSSSGSRDKDDRIANSVPVDQILAKG